MGVRLPFRHQRRNPDLEALLADATAFEPEVRLVPGDVGECHRDVAVLWIDGATTSIGTGYALSDDGLWPQAQRHRKTFCVSLRGVGTSS